jgi:hypothetical protein
MSLVICENGHYYDNAQYAACPHCANPVNDDVTVPLDAPVVDAARGQNWDDSATVALDDLVPQEELPPAEKVAGWLVCVKGPERGRDYRLYVGFNRIGHGIDCEVAVRPGDGGEAPGCAVVYEDRKNNFFAVPRPDMSATVDGEELSAPVPLETGAIISAGDSEFEFVAFCRGGRKWTE